jgi:hypothetical protein
MKTEIKLSIADLNKSKRQLAKAVDRTIEMTEKAIQSSKIALEALNNKGLYFSDNLYNALLHASITQADLAILTEKYALHKRSYEKSLFARFIAMTVIEFIEDINTLIGKELLKELTENGFHEFLPVFKKINEEFSNIKKVNGKMLKEIRNNALAHKSKNGLKLIEHVYKIDTDKVNKLGSDILNISNRITVESNKVIIKQIKILELMFEIIEENKKQPII